MLVTPILSNKVKPVLVVIQAYEWFNCENKICQIISMLNLIAVSLFHLKIFIVKFNVLVNTMIHDRHLVETMELFLIAHSRNHSKEVLVLRWLLLAMQNPVNLNLCLLNQVLKDLALHLDVAHDACGLQVLKQYDTLQPYLILVITFFTVIHAFVSTNEKIKN